MEINLTEIRCYCGYASQRSAPDNTVRLKHGAVLRCFKKCGRPPVIKIKNKKRGRERGGGKKRAGNWKELYVSTCKYAGNIARLKNANSCLLFNYVQRLNVIPSRVARRSFD